MGQRFRLVKAAIMVSFEREYRHLDSPSQGLMMRWNQPKIILKTGSLAVPAFFVQLALLRNITILNSRHF